MNTKKCFTCTFYWMLLLFACEEHCEQKEITWNVDFSSIRQKAEEKQQNFCVVLLDTTNLTSKIYEKYLEDSKMTGMFNLVDIWSERNDWYQQWLYTKAAPLTCIFTSSGNLIDIIPGASRKCFKCIEKVMSQGKMCEELAYYSNFPMDKKAIIPLLNEVLQQKFNMEKGMDVNNRIAALSNSIKYPYIVYLGMKNSMLLNREEKGKSWAEQLLSFNKELDLEIYPKYFSEAKSIIDINYNSSEEPYLNCPPIVYLEDCQQGVAKPFTVSCMNSGNKPLLINDVILDCSCISLLGDTVYTIAPQKSQRIKFEFIADDNGRIEREITIKSNGINPIKKIIVIANNSLLGRKEENMN